MNLGFLDKNSNVTPLLVQLYDSQKLHALATDKKPLARSQLTEAVSELLSMEVSPRETELIADILIELMRQAEVDIRQALAEKVSTLDNVPLRLILQIANDEIVVAHPVLKHSPILSDLDLVYIIKSKTPEYWRSIAERKALSPLVVNNLSATKDEETCIRLTQNQDIELTEKAFIDLAELAQANDEMARSLSTRHDVPESLRSEIIRMVGRGIQETLKDDTIKDVLTETIDELSGDNMHHASEAMLENARQLKAVHELTIDGMISVLRRGQFPTFIAQFAEYTNISPDTAAKIISQKSGQGLAVCCKAVEISKYDFVSMFLLTHKMRSEAHMADVAELGRAVEYFNRIDRETAQKILRDKL